MHIEWGIEVKEECVFSISMKEAQLFCAARFAKIIWNAKPQVKTQELSLANEIKYCFCLKDKAQLMVREEELNLEFEYSTKSFGKISNINQKRDSEKLATCLYILKVSIVPNNALKACATYRIYRDFLKFPANIEDPYRFIKLLLFLFNSLLFHLTEKLFTLEELHFMESFHVITSNA